MTNTQRFQREVSEKLSRLFNEYFTRIRNSQEWRQLPERYRNIVFNNHRYYNWDNFINLHEITETSDALYLCLVEKLLEAEMVYVRNQNTTRYRNQVRIASLLECLYESRTRYYETDRAELPLNYQPRNPIYSPITDLAITPSIYKPNARNHSIGVYSLLHGPILFEAIARLSLITRIKDLLSVKTRENYSSIDLTYYEESINQRPLCLFAIEIENQSNMKHMMGDFLNSLMISKYPLVIVPQNNFSKTLELLRLTSIIYDIKRVNVLSLFSHVMVNTVTQFREVMNQILQEYDVEILESYEINT